MVRLPPSSAGATRLPAGGHSHHFGRSLELQLSARTARAARRVRQIGSSSSYSRFHAVHHRVSGICLVRRDWKHRQGHQPTLCLAFYRESRAGSPPPQEAQHRSVAEDLRPPRQGSHGTEESLVRSGYQSGCLPRPRAAPLRSPTPSHPLSLNSKACPFRSPLSLGSRRMPTSRAQVTSLGARERPCRGALARSSLPPRGSIFPLAPSCGSPLSAWSEHLRAELSRE